MWIKMTQTVKPELPFLATQDTFLCAGLEYEATANQHGAISGVCENGVKMGVRPGEFLFVSAPSWIIDIWLMAYPEACKGVVVEGKV